jgi:hypothetical protein
MFAAATGAIGMLAVTRRLGLGDALRFAASGAPALLAMALLGLGHLASPKVSGELLGIARRGWLRPFFHHDAAGVWSGLVDMLRYWFGGPYDALAVLLLAVGLVVTAVERQVLLLALALGALVLAVVVSALELFPFGACRHSLYLMVFLIPCLANALRVLVVGRSVRHVIAGAMLALLLVHPQPLRRALGTPAIPSRAHVEHVTPRRVLEAAAPRLDRARATPGIVLVDQQSYFTLMPWFHPARLTLRSARAAGGALPLEDETDSAASRPQALDEVSRFRWGAAEVLVSPAWRLRADRRQPEREDHVLGFLRQVDRVWPDLALAERRDATLFFAGWGARFYQPLSTLDEQLGGGCVSAFRLEQGFGWSTLDPARCLAGR